MYIRLGTSNVHNDDDDDDYYHSCNGPSTHKRTRSLSRQVCFLQSLLSYPPIVQTGLLSPLSPQLPAHCPDRSTFSSPSSATRSLSRQVYFLQSLLSYPLIVHTGLLSPVPPQLPAYLSSEAMVSLPINLPGH